jgi:bifunctional non-homologous end joining protein LigD
MATRSQPVVRTFPGPGGDREVKLSHLDKLLFPDDGIRKRDLVDYVIAVSEPLLAALRDRPLSMERRPDGLAGEGFFHRHRPPHFPEWVRTTETPTSRGKMKQVVVDDLATLVLVTNFGCLTPHVPPIRLDRPTNPDQLVVDLDPSVEDLGKVKEAAHRMRELLAEEGLPSFPRWSGSRGVHLVVPLDRSAGQDVVGARAARLAEQAAERHPELLTAAFAKADRGDRIYVDMARNDPLATCCASWSVRARPGAPVAMPIRWEELDETSPRHWTIRTAPERLGMDVWAGFEEARVAVR